MSVETALVALLEIVAGVGQRVAPFAETDPSGKDLPRLAYTLISDPKRYNDDGDGTHTARYQLDVFADRGTAARDVLRKVAKPSDATTPDAGGLDGFRGTVGDTAIRRVYFEDLHDGEPVTIPGRTQTIARATLDVAIVFYDLPAAPPGP